MFWKKKNKYIYVLVRKDLPLADQMVQMGHACFDAGTKHGSLGAWMCLLQVEDEESIIYWNEYLKKNKIKHSCFYEPDPIIDGDTEQMGYTAICTKPIHGKTRELFKDCVLWGV